MAEKKKKSRGNISRRDFLKGMGTGFLSTAVIPAGGFISEEVTAELLGPEAEQIKDRQMIQLKINGKMYRLNVEPRTTLLSALREKLELTGTKEVCDRGQCGACTVMVDDKPILSCMTLALDAREKEITTVEGIGEEDRLSPIQDAFVDKDALMCGFCTPGFIVASTSLLQSNPNPSLDDIKVGLSGNICRCGTYPKVFEAVQQAAKNMKRGG